MKKPAYPYGLIYGPHPSRRLGLSLGVDLTPMTCTFNCVYCERGRTLFGCRDQRDFTYNVELEQFSNLLKKHINSLRYDCLTFSGTGEPTLDNRLGSIIENTHKIVGKTPIKIMTNSSLLNHGNVIQNISRADEIIAKLNAISEAAFSEIHRPYDKFLKPHKIVEGLHSLKKVIDTKLTIEILFIRSFSSIHTNSTKKEVTLLTEVISDLQPGTVQLHTISRLPAESYILPVDNKFLQKVAKYMKDMLQGIQVLTFFNPYL